MIRRVGLAFATVFFAVTFFAVTTLIAVPAPARAAGFNWFNQSAAQESAAPEQSDRATQQDQSAQESQYAQQSQYAQEEQRSQTQQPYQDSKATSSYANNQSNQAEAQNGKQLQSSAQE